MIADAFRKLNWLSSHATRLQLESRFFIEDSLVEDPFELRDN